MRPERSLLFPIAALEVRRLNGRIDVPIHIEIRAADCRISGERLVGPAELDAVCLEHIDVPEQQPIPNPPALPAPSAPRAGVLWFSPMEEAILRAATKEWQTANDFAEKTGQKANHSFYAILGNLADRHALVSGRSGYRLPQVD